MALVIALSSKGCSFFEAVLRMLLKLSLLELSKTEAPLKGAIAAF